MTLTKLKLFDPALHDEVCRTEVRAAIDRVLAGGHYILGPELKELEKEVAAYCGTAHAVGLNSGTDALLFALRALGTRGTEVITTPFTFIATAEMICAADAKPVFVDISNDSLNLDPVKVEKAVTPKTSAIIPVHLYGQPADLTELNAIAKAKGLSVIEDLAQAIGATYRGNRVGGIGTCGCISFFPAKNLGAYGDAGMVVTNDADVAERIRMMRNHGSRVKYEHEFLGDSSRLDDLQAAILRAKLPFLDGWNARRQAIAQRCSEALASVPGIIAVPNVPNDRTCVYQQYTIRVERRKELMEYLRDRGVPTAVHYPKPLHLQPAFAFLGYGQGDFPIAERVADEVLSLPCSPEHTDDEVSQVIDTITAFFRSS